MLRNSEGRLEELSTRLPLPHAETARCGVVVPASHGAGDEPASVDATSVVVVTDGGCGSLGRACWPLSWGLGTTCFRLAVSTLIS
jgi:hypothetical protein